MMSRCSSDLLEKRGQHVVLTEEQYIIYFASVIADSTLFHPSKISFQIGPGARLSRILEGDM